MEVVLAMTVFVASHVVIARTALRWRLQALLGARGYTVFYSFLSVALLAWVVKALLHAERFVVWAAPSWSATFALVLSPIGFLLIGMGAAVPNPLSVSFRSEGAAVGASIMGWVRHPLLIGLTFWAVAHIPANGDWPSLFLFGGSALFGALGIWRVGRRRRKQLGEAVWRRLCATPPGIEPAALKGAAAGLMLWLGFLTLHPLLFGADPLAYLHWQWVTAAKAEDLPVAYPGYSGEYPGFTLLIDERFDSFDPRLWRKGDGAVGGEAWCRFTEQGVQINDGLLELVVREEYVPASYSEDQKKEKGDYPFSCGELRTQPAHRIRYGRIETRMKAPGRGVASGYISSLFTYRSAANVQGDREWEEIDVELEGGRPDKLQANLIYGLNMWDWPSTRAYGAWEDKLVVGPVDEWRVYAIEWLPDRIRWFVDGELIKELTQQDIDCDPACLPPQERPTPIPDDLADIMVNFWIPVDSIQDVFGGNKRDNVYPMVSQYDWLRYYRYEPVEQQGDSSAGGHE